MSWDQPIAGIHPLLWLVIVALIGPPALVSKFAERLPSIFGATARWWRSRDPATASETVSRAEIDRLEADYKRLSKARESDRIEYLGKIDGISKKVDRLEAELTEEKRIRWAAIGYIRILIDRLRRLDPAIVVPDPPEELRDLI